MLIANVILDELTNEQDEPVSKKVSKAAWDHIRETLEEKGATGIPFGIPDREEKKKLLRDKESVLSQDELERLSITTIETSHDAAKRFRFERFRQARISFNVALGFAAIGLSVILFSIIYSVINERAIDLIPVISGVICKAVAALLFILSNQANRQLNVIGDRWEKLTEALAVARISDKIATQEKRDELLSQIPKILGH